MTAQIINLAEYRKERKKQNNSQGCQRLLRSAQSNNYVVVIRDSGRLIAGAAVRRRQS